MRAVSEYDFHNDAENVEEVRGTQHVKGDNVCNVR